MSEKSYRIRTQVNGSDNVVSVQLKQGIRTLNILSLEIDPTDAYDVQTSDYGVVVGRVLANGAFGVPNVKVSAFIPISSQDERDYIISNEYPYRTPQSKGINGVRYNLLYQKAGTFPGKRMVLDNDGCIEVFDKYWKYTTTTNQSGDYMLFGIPTGSTQVHYDCDLSDIGILSQHPYDFIAKGYNANLFKSKTEFLDTEIGKAVHIISQDKTVYVYPFWGDKDGNKIGITRNDIDINYKFEPSCVFMGSVITDQKGSYIGVNGEPNGANGRFDSLATSSGNIEVIRKTLDGGVEGLKDNVVGVIDGNGVWCYQIPMNLDRIGTDEEGNMIAINDPERGIPTRARVRFRISLTDADSPSNSEYTAKMLVPCNPKLECVNENNARGATLTEWTRREPVPEGFWFDYSGGTYSYNLPDNYQNIYEFGSKTPDSSFRDMYWGKVYSVKQYYPRFQYEDDNGDIRSVMPYNGRLDISTNKDLLIEVDDEYDFTNYPPSYSFKQSCISSIYDLNGANTFPYTTLYFGAEVGIDKRIPSWYKWHITDYSGNETLADKGLHFTFENDWINGCLYFPRVIIRKTDGGNTDYFGKRSDDSGEISDAWYEHVYISGRHHWHLTPDGHFQVLKPELSVLADVNEDPKMDYETCLQHNESVFSRVGLHFGIVTKKKTTRDADVYYYRCGGLSDITDTRDNMSGVPCNVYYSGDTIHMETMMTQMEAMDEIKDYGLVSDNSICYLKVYRRLYSTDIVLLGNMEDLYDHLPKLYESLPDTSAIFPPIAPPTSLSEAGMSKSAYHKQLSKLGDSDDLVDIFANNGGNIDAYVGYDTEYGQALYDVVDKIYEKQTGEETMGGDHGHYSNWQRFLVQVGRRYSLFFGVKVWQVEDTTVYDIPTFVNTSRLCELDVHNDSAFKFDNANIVPVNGMIDLYDISTNVNRSAFAAMNYDIGKYIVNSLGNRQYVPTQMVINGFEGRLSEYIDKNYFGYSGDTTYALRSYSTTYPRYAIDDEDFSYTKFRFKSPNNSHGPFTQTEYYNKYDYYIAITKSISGQDLADKIPVKGLLCNESNVDITLHFSYDYNVVLGYGERVSMPIYVEGQLTPYYVLTSVTIPNGGKLGVYSRWKYSGSNVGLWYKSYCHGPLYTPENSFYFYFGLRNGFSALDALKERFVGKLQGESGGSAGSGSDSSGMVSAKQVYNEFDCEGDIVYYRCKIEVNNAKLPVEWEISMGSEEVKSGTIDNADVCVVSGLTASNYNFTAIDADRRVYHSTIPIREMSVSFVYNSYYDVDTNLPVMTVTSIENNAISQESHTIPTREEPSYDKYLLMSADEDGNYYTLLSADTQFTVSVGEVVGWDLSGVSFIFPLNKRSVNVSFIKSDREGNNSCISQTIQVLFKDRPGMETTLSGVPVKYLKGWVASESGLNLPGTEPDSIYNDSQYNIFDGISALDLTNNNTRGFKFNQFDSEKSTEIACVSNMFSVVCGDSEMNLVTGNLDNGFDRIIIGPNFSERLLAEQYMNPVGRWGQDMSVFFDESNSGSTVYFNETAVRNKDVPHIVGSNYPRYINSYTQILSGNTGGLYDNNATFLDNSGSQGVQMRGMNQFGLKSKTSSDKDVPGPLDPRGFTATTSASWVNVKNAVNYYGVRTVDKRFDYQFAAVTPLLLPSGYEDFPNLIERGFSDASVFIDLYGGIRFNYSGDTKEITCFEYVEYSQDTVSPHSAYTDYWLNIPIDDSEHCYIKNKHGEDGLSPDVQGFFSGNTVVVYDIHSYSSGINNYVARFESGIGMIGPTKDYTGWDDDAAGSYLTYLFTEDNINFSNISSNALEILSSSAIIYADTGNYLTNLNTGPVERKIKIPEGARYLIVSHRGTTTQPGAIEILNGFPSLEGMPQRYAIHSNLNDSAKLYDVSAREYYTNGEGGLSTSPVTMSENQLCVWYENDETVGNMPNFDIDHVTYSASGIHSGTDKFVADFTGCSSQFASGFALPGDVASVEVSYDSGVQIVKQDGVVGHDIYYSANVTGLSSSANTVDAHASFSGSSLTIALNEDEAWPGVTFTDIMTEYNHNSGQYPEWAESTDWDSPLDEKPEICLCVCEPSPTSPYFSLSSACTLTADFQEGVDYDDQTCYYATSDSTALSDSQIGDNVTFTAQNVSSMQFTDDSFIIIPTRKVYATPDSPTLLKQGVVKNMGYVYFAGKITVSVYDSGSNKIVKLQLNTPINDAESATKLISSQSNKWHTIGEVEDYSVSVSDATIEYDKTKWTFKLTFDSLSTIPDQVKVYFSIKNGLRYRVDILGLSN